MHKRAFIVIDLGYGDSGKGSIVDWLVREHDANEVMRFNGGAQAGHNVVTEDGRWHEFSQFGAGTFVDGVRTYLADKVVVNPETIFNEEAHLREVGVTDAFERLTISAHALITTPFHVAANRIRELARGDARHGSVGLGFGETVGDALHGHALRAGELNAADLPERLRAIQRRKYEETRVLRRSPDGLDGLASAKLMTPGALRDAVECCRELAARVSIEVHHRLPPTVICEGAQGMLLDERFGFYPYTTWSDCSPRNALLETRHNHSARVIGVCRAYMTRHGPGPFVTEAASLDLPDPHNDFNDWQRDFRVGYTDPLALRYAMRCAGGIDALAVTNCDRISDPWYAAAAYLEDSSPHSDIPRFSSPSLWRQERLGERLQRMRPRYHLMPAEEVPTRLSWALGVPLLVASYGPTAADKVAGGEVGKRPAAV